MYGTTALASTCNTATSCTACFSDFMARMNSREPGSVWPTYGESFSVTVVAHGPSARSMPVQRSTSRFLLPRPVCRSQSGPRPTRSRDAGPGVSTVTDVKRILIAEDNENDLELTLAALESNRLANEIVVVRDGAEALDYLFRRGAYADAPL